MCCSASGPGNRTRPRFPRNAPEIEALALTVEDTGGVVFVPALAGLGAPHWNPEARGVIWGLTRGTERGHIARAALEFGGAHALVRGTRVEHLWRQTMWETIGGGTTEIMRSVVAQQALGLSGRG